MKKITCTDCAGRGHIKIEDTIEPCLTCHANGYLLYVEESEAYGQDCRKGECE
jgi:DnaJ-class molecular chaperone